MNNPNLENILTRVLELAGQNGATSAEATIGTGSGFSVTARMGEPETVEHQRDKGLNVTCFVNHKKGSASTTDFGDKAIEVRKMRPSGDLGHDAPVGHMLGNLAENGMR